MKLLGRSIVELRKLLQSRQISKTELFDYFQKRIKKYNGKINAFLALEKKATRSSSGTLDGVPLAIKDNYCTKDIKTTASSKILERFISPYDATAVARIKKSGAGILGKTNLDAWAHGSSTEASDYGATKNPWDLTRAPGGSSGGSAAAVAAYLAPGAIGSETGGSIRQPASWCGVVGLKPTYGRVSRYGLIAMSSSLDCPGPLTRTVEDAALLLQTIAGKDPYDATTPNITVPKYQGLLRQKKVFSIGLADEYFTDVEPEIKTAVMNAVKILQLLGHRIKKIKLLDPKYAVSAYTILQRSEVASNLGRYDGIGYGENRTHFAGEAKKRIMLGTHSLAYGYYDAFYKKAQKVKTLIIEDFKNVFGDVDLIVAPTTPVTALKIGESEKYPFFGEIMDQLQEPSSIAGIPGITVPVGLDKSVLPIGMQIMGRHFDESSVLNLAYQFEKETDFFGLPYQVLNRYPD